MTVLDDFRQKYPQYKDIPDGKLASAIRTKYYASMDPTEFYKKAGLYQLIDANAGPNGQPAETGLGSNTENALAGMGKSVYDNARGMAQAGVGLANVAMSPTNMIEKAVGNKGVVTDALDSLGNKYAQLKDDQSQVNAQDAPLMNTKAGIAGNIVGQGAQAVAGGTALKAAGLGGSILP
jgi:hypothetical protein